MRRDADREQDLLVKIEEQPLVQNLRDEFNLLEKENEDLRNEIWTTKCMLNEQIEKYEKFELSSRKLKKKNKIFESLMKIELRSPQTILDEFRSGKT